MRATPPEKRKWWHCFDWNRDPWIVVSDTGMPSSLRKAARRVVPLTIMSSAGTQVPMTNTQESSVDNVFSLRSRKSSQSIITSPVRTQVATNDAPTVTSNPIHLLQRRLGIRETVEPVAGELELSAEGGDEEELEVGEGVENEEEEIEHEEEEIEYEEQMEHEENIKYDEEEIEYKEPNTTEIDSRSPHQIEKANRRRGVGADPCFGADIRNNTSTVEEQVHAQHVWSGSTEKHLQRMSFIDQGRKAGWPTEDYVELENITNQERKGLKAGRSSGADVGENNFANQERGYRNGRQPTGIEFRNNRPTIQERESREARRSTPNEVGNNRPTIGERGWSNTVEIADNGPNAEGRRANVRPRGWRSTSQERGREEDRYSI